MKTKHAKSRAQKRCIPPLIDEWLSQFGEEEYDGHGAIRRYFSHRSKRKMDQLLGRQIVQHNSKWLNTYKVESSVDGSTITLGWRTRRIKRPK